MDTHDGSLLLRKVIEVERLVDRVLFQEALQNHSHIL